MNDVCIPLVLVANVINNWVTGMLESSTCGSCDIDYDKKYVIFRDWVNMKGEVVSLTVKGSDIMDSYRKHGEGKLPSWILTHPYPEDFAKRVFIRLLDTID